MATQSGRSKSWLGIPAFLLLAGGVTLWSFAAKPVEKESLQLAGLDCQTTWRQGHDRNSSHGVRTFSEMTPDEREAAVLGSSATLRSALQRDVNRIEQAAGMQVGASLLFLLGVLVGIKALHGVRARTTRTTPSVPAPGSISPSALLRQREPLTAS